MDSQAQQYLDKAERLSPFNPLQFSVHMVRAVSLVNQQKYEEAAEASLRATNYDNAYFSTYAIATACLQLAGRTEQAQQYAAKVLSLKPNYSTELYQRLTPHADEEKRALFICAMRSAGIPETSVVH
jgi:tetratricopeptide (TPR) repeat protein